MDALETNTPLRKTILYPNAPWYFALAIVITCVGFSFTFFRRLGTANVFHHLHGASAVLWMCLLIVQPMLYRRGQLRLHRRLGWLGALGLAPLLVMGGIKMLHQGLQAETGNLPPETYQLVYYDAVLLVLFAVFLALSLWHGKRVALHARYIACTVLVILPPALFRLLFFSIPWFHRFDKSLHGSIPTIELVLLLLLLDDRRYGPIRRPYVVALGLLLGLSLTMSFADGWPWWRAVVDALANSR